MSLDIVQVKDGFDLGFADSSIPKAANVLSVQLGDLEYASGFGIDKRYFMTSPFNFQRESFKAHIVQRLTESQVSVMEALEFLEALAARYRIGIGTDNENLKGLIK